MKYFITAYDKGVDYVTNCAKNKKLISILILKGYCVKQINQFYFIVKSRNDINIDVDFDYYISREYEKEDSEIIQHHLNVNMNDVEVFEWFIGKYPAHYVSLIRNCKTSLKKLVDLEK